jgi:hypothetical protein
MGLVIQEGRPSLLSFEEREICSRISTGDGLDGQRALALLAVDDGMTQANAAAQAGLTPNQVKYCLTLFRRQRLDMFPPELLADPVEPMAQVADAPPPAADEAAAEESPAAEPLPQKATAEEEKAKGKKAKKSSDKEEKPKKQTKSKKDNGKKGKGKKSKGKKGQGKKKAKKDKSNGKGGKKSKKKKKKK